MDKDICNDITLCDYRWCMRWQRHLYRATQPAIDHRHRQCRRLNVHWSRGRRRCRLQASEMAFGGELCKTFSGFWAESRRRRPSPI
ncbi:hypothetical protein PENTCL1PPCAC_26480, partial [Pristionchus entomophagus]